MPVESVQPLLGRPLRTAALATPPRLRPKGPVGPEFYRQSPTAAERPRQSAVERLEADKAKYVKSPVALSKQQPIRPPVMRKPPATANNAAMRPTRKTPTQQNTQQGNVPFNLAHLSNLINNVNDGAHLSTSSTVTSEDALASNCTTASTATTRSFTSTDLDDAGQGEERPGPPPPGPDWSSPAKVRLKASGPSKAESPGSPATATVRRVDVMPQARPARTPPCRPPRYIRQPLQPMSLFSQSPLRPATSNQHLFYPRKSPGPSPLKPVSAPPKPDHPASSPDDTSSPVDTPAPPPLPLPVLPPASPAITRLSSTSSRKRPSLSRSKSDMSERYSRAGTELERFFSLCGLDPSEMQDLTKASSDIVSLARFRSASAPGSECGGSDREEGVDNGGEDDGDVTERVPYGVSVIERNARVIKWLYGVRQAKDNTKVTNM